MNKAYAAFSQLSQPEVSDPALSATPFPGHESHRVAKSRDGEAVVLVRVPEGAKRLTPVKTENLQVVYAVPCQVRYPSGEVGRELFTSLTCLGHQPSLIRYFFEVAGSLLDVVGSEVTAEELDSGIRSLLRLFQALTLPSRGTTQGLWAELFLIATSSDKEQAARAWHSEPGEHWDFARGPERLEVKSSSLRQRRHYFSLEQVVSTVETHIAIASVFVERSSGGTSLEAIMNEVCEGLPGDLQGRVRRLAAETLGAAFVSALDHAYDRELAGASVRFYDSSTVPKPTLPLPEGVSDVRFCADLTHAPPIATVPEDSSLLRIFHR